MSLRGNRGLRSKGAAALARALRENQTLTALDLGCAGLGATGARSVALALATNRRHAVTDLRVDGNQVQ